MSLRETNWKRLTVESIAIIASILFAFAIDAWWEDRQQFRSDDAHLTAVLNELQRHRELLNEAVSAHQATLLTGAEIQANISSADTDKGEKDLPELLSDLLSFYQINAPFGALETAMLGGAIPRMKNKDLATRLANWPVAIEDLLEEQTEGFQMLMELQSTMSKRVSLAAAYKKSLTATRIRGTVEVVELDAIELGDSAFRFDRELLTDSHEIENKLLLLMILASSAKAEATIFSSELDSLIDELGECLQSTRC